jgi:acyl transferase domain-containing protein
VSQSAITAIQVAAVELLNSWGVYPSRVVGHSSGEIAAAFAAGGLSREAAWKAAYYRGAMADSLSGKKGGMLAVGATESDLNPYLAQVNNALDGELTIACFNSPKNLTVSGELEKIELLKTLLDRDGVFSRILPVKNAYHSGHMREMAEEYEKLTEDLSFGKKLHLPCKVNMFSSVTSNIISHIEVQRPRYWAESIVSPVHFSRALTAMCSKSPKTGRTTSNANEGEDLKIDIIVEIGPHSALRSAIQETLAQNPMLRSIDYSHILSRVDQTLNPIFDAAGMLYCRGYQVNIMKLNSALSDPGSKPPRLLSTLPPYPFEHSRNYGQESRLSINLRQRKYPKHDLFGAPVADWNVAEPRWRNIIRVSEIPWVADHVVSIVNIWRQ